MDNPDIKTVIDDVRARDAALLNLILFNDRQAMALYRVYVTLAVAGAATATAGFFRDDPLLEFTRWGLIGAVLVLAIGCWFCTNAMAPGEVGFPGRTPEYWQWARDPQISDDAAVDEYLKKAALVQDKNHELNKAGAAALTKAKRAGIAAPIIGLLAGAIAIALRLL